MWGGISSDIRSEIQFYGDCGVLCLVLRKVDRDFGSDIRGGTRGHRACPMGLFFEHSHVEYQTDGDDERN